MGSVSSVFPHGPGDGAEDDDGCDGDEPGQQAEDDADLAVELAVGDDRGGEVDRGEPVEADSKQRGDDREPEQRFPGPASGQQEAHRPPQEQR